MGGCRGEAASARRPNQKATSNSKGRPMLRPRPGPGRGRCRKAGPKSKGQGQSRAQADAQGRGQGHALSLKSIGFLRESAGKSVLPSRKEVQKTGCLARAHTVSRQNLRSHMKSCFLRESLFCRWPSREKVLFSKRPPPSKNCLLYEQGFVTRIQGFLSRALLPTLRKDRRTLHMWYRLIELVFFPTVS